MQRGSRPNKAETDRHSAASKDVNTGGGLAPGKASRNHVLIRAERNRTAQPCAVNGSV